MQENKLIACFLRSREAYEKILPLLPKQQIFSSLGEHIISEVKSFYDTDSAATHVDLDLIKQKLIAENPKKDFLIEEYFANIPVDVSVNNVLKLYEDVYKDSLRSDLILCLNSKDDERADELIKQLHLSLWKKMKRVYTMQRRSKSLTNILQGLILFLSILPP